MVVSDLPGTKEVLAVCGSGHVLSLNASNDEWAEALSKAVDSPRQEQWLAEMENSAFGIDNALGNLLSIYKK